LILGGGGLLQVLGATVRHWGPAWLPMPTLSRPSSPRPAPCPLGHSRLPRCGS